MTGSSIAINIPVSGRSVALVCLALSALGLAASLVLSWTPAVASNAGLAALLAFAPQTAGFFALLGGGLCLVLGTAEAPKQPVPDQGSPDVPTLQAVFRDFNHLLMEERDRLAAFQEVFGATTKEAMTASGRLAKLATTAADAETRLGAGIARAEEALRQPTLVVTWAAETAQRMEQALPELAEVIRREIAEQSQAANAALDAAVARLVADTDSPLRTFTGAAAEATDQITRLGETSARLRQDMLGLDTVGREIVTASAVVVARVGEAVGHFETTLATLPAATRLLTEAANQAAHAVAEGAATLSADSAALDVSGREVLQVVALVRTTAQGIADRLDSVDDAMRHTGASLAFHVSEAKVHMEAALAALPATAAELTIAADRATQSLTEAANGLRTDGIVLAEAGREALQAAETLRTAGHDVTASSAAAMSHAGSAMAQVDAAVARLPEITIGIAAAADQAARTLTEAAVTLTTGSAALDAFGRESLQAVVALRTTGQDIADSLHATTEALRNAGNGLAVRGGEAMVQIDAALLKLPEVTAGMAAAADDAVRAISAAAETLAVNGATFDTSARESTHAAEALRVTEQAIIGAGHDVAAVVSQAVETTTGRLIAVLAETDQAQRATASLTERLEAACTTLADRTTDLDVAGRRMAAVGEGFADRLVASTTGSEAVLRALPEVAAEISGAAAALQLETGLVTAAAQQMSATGLSAATAMTDVLSRTEGCGAMVDAASHAIGSANDVMAIQIRNLAEVTGRAEKQASVLPEAARSIRAAADRVAEAADRMASGATAEPGSAGPATMLLALATDMRQSFGRFEVALERQETAWPSVLESTAQVQHAVVAVRAAMDQPPVARSG